MYMFKKILKDSIKNQQWDLSLKCAESQFLLGFHSVRTCTLYCLVWDLQHPDLVRNPTGMVLLNAGQEELSTQNALPIYKQTISDVKLTCGNITILVHFDNFKFSYTSLTPLTKMLHVLTIKLFQNESI